MATGTEIERLFVKIEGDIAGLKASMGKAVGEVDKAEKQMTGRLDKLAGSFTSVGGAARAIGGPIGVAAAAILAASRIAVKYADDLNDQALALGINVEKLQELRFAGQQNGVASEDLDRALMKLNLTTGDAIRNGGAAAEKFERLGISIKDANGETRDTGAIFEDIVARLSKIPSAAERAAAAGDLMGDKLGLKLNQMLGLGTDGLNAAIAKAREMGAVIDQDVIDKAAKANDELDALATVAKARTTVALAELAPALITIAEWTARVADGAAAAAIAIDAMLGGRPQPLQGDIEKLEARIELIKVQMGEAAKGDPKWLADLTEELLQVQGVLDITKQKQLALMSGKSATVAGKAAPTATTSDAADLAKLSAAEAKAHADRLSAQKAVIEALITNEQGGMAERLALIGEATQAERNIENAAYATRLKELQGMDAKTVEAKAAQASAIEELQAAHQLRLEQIEAGGITRRTALMEKADAEAMKSDEARRSMDEALTKAAQSSRDALMQQQMASAQDILANDQSTAEQRLAAAAQYNALAQEQEIAAHNARLEELSALNAETDEQRMVRDQAIRDENAAHESAMTSLLQEGTAARLAIEEAAYQAKIAVARAMFTNLSALMGSHSRKAFEIGKTAAIAETIISTIESAGHSFKWGSKIGGPVVGAAFAATALAAGYARVQAIKSTSFGNKSVGVGVGGSSGSMSVASGGLSDGGGEGGRRVVYISGINPNDLFSGRQLIDLLNTAQGDGAVLKAVS